MEESIITELFEPVSTYGITTVPKTNFSVYLCDGGFSTPPTGMIDSKYGLSKQRIHSLYAYIEYGKTKILFDTGYDGLNSDCNSMKILSYFLPIDKSSVRTELPYSDNEIDLVIISHYHPDHIARLKYFPNAKFLAWGKPETGLFSGFNESLLPADFYSRVSFVSEPKLNEWGFYAHTINDKLQLVKLDGHSSVHSGLLVDNKIFFIGDAVWTRSTYRENAYPSFLTKIVQTNNSKYVETIEKIKFLHKNTSLDIIPSHCPEIVEKMNGQPYIQLKYEEKNFNNTNVILVTGASGFLGSNTVNYLAEKGFNIVGCGRKTMTYTKPNMIYEKIELTDKSTIDYCMEKYKPTYVIHCGALCGVDNLWADYYSTNVIGTKNMLASSIANKVKRFIHISSPSVYLDNNFRGRLGLKETNDISEKSQTNYTKSKTLAEFEVMKILPNCEMETIILRPRGIYGKGDTTLLPKLKKKISFIPYLGSNLVSLTWVNNVSHAIFLALTNGTIGNAYNITDQVPYNIQVIFDKIKTKFQISESLVNKINLSHRVSKYILSKASGIVEYTASKLGAVPPITPYTMSLIAYDCTLCDKKAQTELKYFPLQVNMFDEALE
jgi:dTDP-4-dehydrorhamnose 3,5-epimerase